ncbi:MAG: SPOR domain-containing protein [Trueperaceae bacterium]|nr:SPOR domain-containing protein [Trueperaceae bacterium]
MRRLGVLLALLLSGSALAQEDLWTVQVIALRDYREAQLVAAELRQFGLDTYTEFAMQDGLQFVRVRLGCFVGRNAAEALSRAVTGRLTAEAEPVELTRGAPVTACSDQVVGFLDDYSWRYLGNGSGVPTFSVTVAGKAATIVHDADRWYVVQDGGDAPERAVTETARFTQRRHGGVLLVTQLRSDELVVCPGSLIATIGEWALVDRGDAVVACRFVLGGAP